MDEDEITEDNYVHAKRHSKWSVLILGLNYATQVAQQTSNFLGELTIAAAQHANQIMYDKKFGTITDNFQQWERK